MKIIVFRDEFGKVINIGEWDYMISTDELGNEIANNPLPPNMTSTIEEVRINEDGSRSTVL